LRVRALVSRVAETDDQRFILEGGDPMLRLAVGLLIVAIIAAVLGFGGIAGTAAGLAKIAFFVFLVLAVISFLFRGGRAT
jgi:uncharacterized membrane protein YtjA (UPF0391 family)